jgi:hypothetical protein
MDVRKGLLAAPFLPSNLLKRLNGRDRDRTDDLYRVKVARVIYLINLSLFSLHDPASFLMMLGA